MALKLLLTLLLLAASAGAQGTAYAHSIQTAVARRSGGLEVLVLDLRTHDVLADTFAAPGRAIPPGSLLKPFVALAYGAAHGGRFPTVVCRGHVDRCWNAAGHGPLALTEALAASCNAYFLALARGVDAGRIPYLPASPQGASAEMLIGLTADWRISPRALAEAYAALLAAPETATTEAIRAGMRGSAAHGTAVRIGAHTGGVLAKTGTAPCVDAPCKASGDGLVAAAVPAAHPALVVLVRKRGTTGAMTAAAAGRVLSELEALHAE